MPRATHLFCSQTGANPMNEEYEIVRVENPEQSAWGIIGRNLDEFNRQQAGDYNSQRIGFVVQTPDQAIVGGIIAVTYWGS